VLGFVSVSKGYKAGGFNLGEVPDDSRRSYGRESLWNVEAGVKSTLQDGTVILGASVFHSRREDQQVRTSLQLVPGDPASFVFFTDNAAQGRTLGFEAALRWLPAEAWEFYLNVGLLDAKFTEFRTLQTGQTELSDLGGRAQAHAPKYTLATGAAWRSHNGLFASVDLSARDRFYFDVSNNQQSSPYRLANVRIGFDALYSSFTPLIVKLHTSIFPLG
jgi:outer membrane receptor protein involved in Fe transport